MPYMEGSSGSPVLSSGLASLVICNRKSGVLNVENGKSVNTKRYCG